ncbi:MAG: cobalamin B12-binding domain-containing protein [Pirellulales bacterium]|nr:cobalamin B12-binding domain-containing protein [Pirellulales bacterium]
MNDSVVKSLSPRQMAQLIGASESSVKRWCDTGRIPSTLTPGGHRKIDVSTLLGFVKSSKYQLVQPEILGIKNASIDHSDSEVTQQIIFDALTSGHIDEAFMHTSLAFIGGQSLPSLLDEVITPVFARIGDEWECGELHVYQERIACRNLSQLLLRLRALITINPHGPMAIGGTLSGDPYELPSLMVELLLLDAGWKANFLGANLPSQSILSAIENLRPELIWVSVSSIDRTVDAFAADMADIWEKAHGIPVIVGGRALNSEVRRNIRASVFCDNMQQMRDCLATLNTSARRLMIEPKDN